MECSLGPMGSPQKSTTRFRQLRYQRAGRAHGTTNPTREGNRPTNTTRWGQEIIRRIIGIPIIQRLRISNNMVTPNIHSSIEEWDKAKFLLWPISFVVGFCFCVVWLNDVRVVLYGHSMPFRGVNRIRSWTLFASSKGLLCVGFGFY